MRATVATALMALGILGAGASTAQADIPTYGERNWQAWSGWAACGRFQEFCLLADSTVFRASNFEQTPIDQLVAQDQNPWQLYDFTLGPYNDLFAAAGNESDVTWCVYEDTYQQGAVKVLAPHTPTTDLGFRASSAARC